MDQLKLLRKLEEHTDLLKKSKENLGLQIKDEELQVKDNEIQDLIIEIEKLEARLLVSKSEIRKEEVKLQEFQYKIEEVDKELYSGHIKDVNQLEYLSREKEDLLEMNNSLELEVLSMMEIEEKMKLDNTNLKDNLGKQKQALLEIRKEYEKNLEENKARVLEEESSIDYLNQQIQGDILEIYNNLKSKKGLAIVPVNNNICSGCNMRIPAYLTTLLKSKLELAHCENCGRILYHNDEVEDGE